MTPARVGKLGTATKRRQLWPRQSEDASAAETAIGAGDDAIATDEPGEPLDSLGHEFRVFDDVRRMGDVSRCDALAHPHQPL